MRYSGIQQIQLDTARNVRIQLDTVGYSGIQWICCKMARYLDRNRGRYAGYQGYGETQCDIGGIQVKYRRGISQKYTPGGDKRWT